MSGEHRELEKRMEASLEAFEKRIASVRAGRARTTMLEPVVVVAYGGSRVPIDQMATLSTPDPRTLQVQVWDASQAPAVDKAIRESDLGFNPVLEGSTIRIPIPPLSEERRKELARTASGYAEEARVAVRNIRRDGIEGLREEERGKRISEDERERGAKEIQKITDSFVERIDALLAAKERDITSV